MHVIDILKARQANNFVVGVDYYEPVAGPRLCCVDAGPPLPFSGFNPHRQRHPAIEQLQIIYTLVPFRNDWDMLKGERTEKIPEASSS